MSRFEALISKGFFGCRVFGKWGRATPSVKIRNEEGHAFQDAIGPAKGIVLVESCTSGFDGGLASCGVGAVIQSRGDSAQISTNPKYRTQSQQGDCFGEAGKSFFFPIKSKSGDHVDNRDKQRVVGDLEVVKLELQ